MFLPEKNSETMFAEIGAIFISQSWPAPSGKISISEKNALSQIVSNGFKMFQKNSKFQSFQEGIGFLSGPTQEWGKTGIQALFVSLVEFPASDN